MRRVYVMWTLRKLTRPRAFQAYVLLIAIYQVLSNVSISNVLHNAPAPVHVRTFMTFVTGALSHTGIVIQVSLAIGAIFGLWLARDVIKNIINMRRENLQTSNVDWW